MKRFNLEEYRRIYVPLIIFLAMIIVVVSVTFATIYYRITVEKWERIYTIELQNSVEKTRTAISNAYLLLRQIAYDRTAYKLMNYKELPVSQYMQSLSQLRDYLNVHDSIISIYLCNAESQDVFVCGSIFDQSEYTFTSLPDQELIENLDRNQIKMGPIFRKIKPHKAGASENEMNVLTLMYTLTPGVGYILHDTIAVNFDPDQLISIPASYALGGILLFTNQDGDILYSSEKQLAIENVFEFKASKPKKDQYVSIGGKTYCLFLQNNTMFGWNALLAVPYELIGEKEIGVIRLSIYIGILLIGIAWVFSFWVSKRIYRFSGLENMPRLVLQNKSSLEKLQRHLIFDIVQGRHKYNRDELAVTCQALDMDMDVDCPTYAIAIRIDYWPDIETRVNEDFVLSIYDEAIKVCCTLEGKWIGTSLHHGEFLFLYQIERANIKEDEIADDLLMIIRRIQHDLASQMGVSVSGMVGEKARFLYEWNEYGKLLLESLYMYRLFHGYSVAAVELENSWRKKVYPKREEQRIIECLKMCKFEAAREAYDEFIRQINQDDFHFFDLSLVHLSLMINETVQSIIQNNSLTLALEEIEIDTKFKNVEIIDQINRIFFRVFDRLADALDNHHAHHKLELADQIADYIDKNCGNPDMSRQMIADEWHLSYTQISAVFKTKYPEGITSYINAARLKRACELLEENSNTIDIVSSTCGFSDTGYFHRVFKKKYGVTPGEYRRINCRKEY